MSTTRTRRTAAAVAAVLAVAGIGLGAATSSAKSGAESASAESTTISKTFSSSTLTVGLTNEGNMQQFQPVGGLDHMFSEGYVACYNGLSAVEAGGTTSGWAGATTTFPSGTTMRVVRLSTDGKVKLQQDFTFAASTKRLQVKNTLTNNSAATLTNVTFIRFADIDANGGSFDVWGRTADSAFAYDDGVGGMATSFVSASSGVTKATKVGGFGVGCTNSGVPTPVTGDQRAVIEFTVGNLAAGKSKTFTMAYSLL